MIIGVDGTPILGVRSGPGWYLTHLLEALSFMLEEDKILVWMNNPHETERSRIPETRYLSRALTRYPASALKMSWNALGTPTLESLVGRSLDACFYAALPVPPQKKGAKILFVHDLAAWTAPEWAMSPQSRNYGKELEKQIEAADLVLTGSEFCRKEMRRLFARLTDEKVRVVPHGLAKLFQKPASSDKVEMVKKKLGLSLPFFLYAGTIETRKNLLRLVHGFLIYLQQSGEKAELILAGAKGWVGEEFMQFILSPALKGKVRWIGAVEPEDLWALYSGAEAFAYPALSEGFGMPILEAMGCGAPVLYASTGALPELAGDAGLGVGSSDVGQWAAALMKLHRDQDLRDEMRHRGFARSALYRWETTAKQTLTSIVDAAKAHG